MTAGAVMARARSGTVRAALEPVAGLPSPPRRTRDCPARTGGRLTKTMGLQGVVRGKKVVTTNPDAAQPCPDDTVNRTFKADMPNQLRVSDVTHVSGWQGMVYVAPRYGHSDQGRFQGSIIDVFARKILGWRVSTSMTTGFVLDALNQAICQRAPSQADKLIPHSDRGSQYPSIRYTGRLAEAGIDISVGTVGGSYDNALAESIIGLFKTEVIRFLGPWRSVAQVKWETLKWVDWYNNPRLHSTIGYVTPKEAEEIAYASVNAAEKAASSMKQKLAGKTRGSSVCCGRLLR